MAAAASLLSSSACTFFRRLPSAPHVFRSARFQRFNKLRRFSPAAMSTASGLKEAPANNPGLHTEMDPATKGYFMQQTVLFMTRLFRHMLRVKDPKVSLDFYSRVMGMSLLKRLDFAEMKFSLYFLGYEDVSSAPADHIERTNWTFRQKATLELTHNWGTESDSEFKGHIGVAVDDVYKACERFERLGVEFVKKPNDGSIKGIAFIKDPDGYWIEIFDQNIGTVTASAS
ncbi:hypothetical protein PR202_ga30403 [Eleusine coracana subsp. coracana]|uniref:Lactoylglutathione lyase n=1 Tax=Eleusine coracana subsp. coracana TaxID=191504 RepID=A0AAV5DMG0_ELECO|nr:hypothetical protein PR202_ga30403 [Eleusine coracana subsp. coracana]